MFYGYRRYKIHAWDTSLVGAHDIWNGREMQAKCDYSSVYYGNEEEQCKQHLLAGTCKCGIYVLKQPDIVPDYKVWPGLVQVVAWGAFIEFELGWRVQYARMEHIWVEPEWIESLQYDWDPDELLRALSVKYDVSSEIRRSAICCGRDHEQAYWPSAQGPLPICKMGTSHINNCLKYISKAARRDVIAAKWELVFEDELKRRAPAVVDGKMKVTF